MSATPNPQSASIPGTQVAAAAANTTLFAAATGSVRYRAIFNGGSTALNVLFAATAASTTAFTLTIAIGGFYEFTTPVYAGQVQGIWAGSPTGAAQITQY